MHVHMVWNAHATHGETTFWPHVWCQFYTHVAASTSKGSHTENPHGKGTQQNDHSHKDTNYGRWKKKIFLKTCQKTNTTKPFSNLQTYQVPIPVLVYRIRRRRLFNKNIFFQLVHRRVWNSEISRIMIFFILPWISRRAIINSQTLLLLLLCDFAKNTASDNSFFIQWPQSGLSSAAANPWPRQTIMTALNGSTLFAPFDTKV